jgi:hypothetical protein
MPADARTTIDNSDTGGHAPIVLPRGLILLGFGWLMVSWAMAMGFRPPLHPSAASYEPGVKLMLLFLMIGITIAWPLYRLSQPAAARPIVQTVLDLVVLLAMSQVVIWPLRLVTTWSRQTTGAMDAGLIAWTMLIGAIVAATCGASRTGPRTLGMTACLVFALVLPALAWAGIGELVAGERGVLSPILLMHTLADGASFNPTRALWLHIGVVGVAAAGAWVAVLSAGMASRAQFDGRAGVETGEEAA